MKAKLLAVLFALLAAAHGESFKRYDAAAVKRFEKELSRLGVALPSSSRPHEQVHRPDPAVSAPAGDFEGYWTKSQFGRPIAAFEGIPYAQPPVGELRFKVAKPLANRLADFKAKKPGSMCVQNDMIVTKKLTGSEDCLFINVYVPEKVQRANGEKLPVMFFVHGGGYIFGQGDFYQSNVLLDKDVVLVTMNYRLGPLGFMTTEDDVIPANLALKDQVAALRWVHDNIASFGGDPNLVTVFGHSAGSSSTQFLMMSPLTKGLMHRVIAMSGSVFAPWALSRPGQMAAATRKRAEKLGCPPEPSKAFLACLQTKTAEEITHEESAAMTITFMPVVEGDVPGAHIPHHPKKMLSEGPSNDVPYMSGVTSEEGLMFVAGLNDSVFQGLDKNFAPQTTAMLFLPPEDAEKVESLRKTYISPGPMSRANLVEYSHIFGDLLFVWPALKADRYRRKGAKSPGYFYYFTYQSPNLSFLELNGIDLSKGNYYGVNHGDDLFYLFKMPMETKTTPQDILMSMIMTDIYTSFARDGVPSSPLLKTKWQPVASKGSDIEYLHFRSPLDMTMQKDLVPERWSLLHKVFDCKEEHDEL